MYFGNYTQGCQNKFGRIVFAGGNHVIDAEFASGGISGNMCVVNSKGATYTGTMGNGKIKGNFTHFQRDNNKKKNLLKNNNRIDNMKIIEDSRNLEPDIIHTHGQAKLFAKKDNTEGTDHCNKDNEAKTSTNTSENNNNEINKVFFFPDRKLSPIGEPGVFQRWYERTRLGQR